MRGGRAAAAPPPGPAPRGCPLSQGGGWPRGGSPGRAGPGLAWSVRGGPRRAARSGLPGEGGVLAALGSPGPPRSRGCAGAARPPFTTRRVMEVALLLFSRPQQRHRAFEVRSAFVCAADPGDEKCVAAAAGDGRSKAVSGCLRDAGSSPAV